jgi:hypothetical protein
MPAAAAGALPFAGKAAGGKGLAALVKGKPAVAFIAVGGAAAAAYTIMKRRKAGAGGAPSYIAMPAGRNDSTSSDLYNLLQPEIEYLASQLGKPATAAPAPASGTGWDKFNQNISDLITGHFAGQGAAEPAGMAFLERQNWARQGGLPYVTGDSGGTVFNPATGQTVLASVFNAYPEAQRALLTQGAASAWSQLKAPAQ